MNSDKSMCSNFTVLLTKTFAKVGLFVDKNFRANDCSKCLESLQ